MPLFITKLGHYPIVLGHPWMKKHGVLFDIINDYITFFSGYYTYPGTPLFLVFIIAKKKIEIIFIATHQDFFANQILKRGSAKKIDDFLNISEKTSKKTRLIDISKRKFSMDKLKPKTVVISTLDYFGEERLPILIPETNVSTLAIKEVNIAIIDADVYCITCKVKRA